MRTLRGLFHDGSPIERDACHIHGGSGRALRLPRRGRAGARQRIEDEVPRDGRVLWQGDGNQGDNAIPVQRQMVTAFSPDGFNVRMTIDRTVTGTRGTPSDAYARDSPTINLANPPQER
jgi:hypothetical protein